MEAGSEEEINRNLNQSPPVEGSKRPKRQMKTPFQLEVLEKTYAMEMYPSEATRVELSEKLGLTDRQLQMWFCHRRLKDKKEAVGMAAMKPRNPGSAGRRSLTESPREELMAIELGSGHVSGSGSGSGSESGSGSGSSKFDDGDDIPMVPLRYYESPKTLMERRVIACVEAQLGEPLRENGPILGMEFEELPPGAFGAPIVPREKQDRYRHSYDSKLHGQYDAKHIKAASTVPHEAVESKTRSDAYGHVAPPYLYDSPVDGPTAKSLSLMHGNGHLPREYDAEGQVSNAEASSQPGRQLQFSSPRNTDFDTNYEDNMHIERKRKSDEGRMGKDVQSHEKKMRKELEKQDLLRRKREEQIKREMERQDRERRKEEQRMMREQQRQEEKFQREERREMERREKFMQKELLQAERRKQKEELRKEKEAARQKAAMERATARKIAKESMELIEDERLELMELAASSKGLPSIVSLDYDTLQNLDSYREALCEFPPKSVQLKMPFTTQPWINSEENVGKLLMVWKFCVTFADVLGLWPFTLDEFVQAFHDYDSRLLVEIHITILKLIIKDIEDVVRTPSGGPGTNQYSAVNPEGGHPHIVEGAYLWGFDIRNWQKHLNPSTWTEILRQFALSAGFGPELKKKGIDRVCPNDNDENKGCEDIVSTLLNGSAAENAVAIMKEKGLSLQRKSRHRLTPGTVKFAAYHVLALEGSKGLNVIELAEKIQKSGLRDLTTSKTPEASISVALSRDPILFERIAPSTYCVRPAFRKDPDDAESLIAAAKEKIQRYANGFLVSQNADEEERDDDSDSDIPEGGEVDALATPSDTNKKVECNEVASCSGNIIDKLPDDDASQNRIGRLGNPNQGVEIDESRSGEPWVQGLTEGEYSDLSVEERLNALVALIGMANEGNSIRVVLEDRLDAANALKKQMWAEAQLDKRRMREDIITKFCDSSLNVVAEGGQSPLVAENKVYDPSASTVEKEASSLVADDLHNSADNPAHDTPMGQFISLSQQNGYTAEKSRLQLKSYIGHRAEETYVYRSLPLGQDRRRNRYWQFVATASSLDPGSGRIFVESPHGYWRLIDSEEAFDALLTSLDTRGTRESHLHIMLQKIEVCFKECVRRFKLAPNILDENRNGENRNDGEKEAKKGNSSLASASVESPSSAVFSSNTDLWEPSLSFRIDLGRNEAEKKNFWKRYEDLQIWIWKACFNSSTLCAMAYGKKRCLPLLGICDVCFGTFDAKMDHCPCCQPVNGRLCDQGNFSEQFNHENKLIDGNNTIISNTLPLRIRLIKALLNLVEVSVPSEALHSAWTEDCRNTWGLQLQSCSSAEDLLKMLTQFERAIKRDYLSSDFETAEELVSYCASSYPGSVPQLPWIPSTTAAVALRLLELDASISYTPNQKSEILDEKKVEALPKVTLKYAYTKDIHKSETMEFDRYGSIKEENWDHLRDSPGISGYKQVARGRGGRPRGKSQKGVKGSISQSSRQNTKQEESLAQILLQQQGVRTQGGQKHGRGRRTLRRRRTEKNVVTETLPNYLDYMGTSKNVVEKKPVNSGREELINSSNRNIVAEHDDTSNSDSDDNANENLYEFKKWGSATYDDIPSRSNEMMEMSEEDADEIEEENGYEEEDGENMEGDMEINDDESDRDGDGNRDEGSESIDSGEEYSD